jgi:hypothetical protein
VQRDNDESMKMTVQAKDAESNAAQVEVMLPGWSPRLREEAVPPPPPARLPRVTRLMALAIKFQDMVSRSEVRDYADLARLGYVTRARITQIMNLLNLVPNTQEEILSCESDSPGIQERQLRSVTSQVLWHEQRRLWRSIRPPRCLSTSATASEIRSG